MKPARTPFHRRSAHVAGTALILFFELGIPARQAMGGDILRGGHPGGLPQGATNPVGTTPPPIIPAGGTTRDSLARTAMAIQSVQAMQLAARNLANGGANHAGTNPSGTGAILPDVPDGLGTGGLQVDPRVTAGNLALWKGANLPVQSTTSGGTVQVTVKQTAQQALLNWETFNVGKNTTLTFDQTDGGANVGQWIAFNFVNDPLASPTQILGNIEAKGQVYVMNRNGIVFGGKSQVNVRGLTVSSLPINTNLIANGLLNNPDAQFLFSGVDIPAGANGTPAFTPEPPPAGTGRYGDIIVEAGAVLTSPSNEAKVGGRITLVGPNVTNHGSILTPDGQAILASGLQVGFNAHSTTDPSLRGLDVFVGQVGTYAGTSTNTGLIQAQRGSIVIAGRAVNQNGAISSTTSVSLNGRVDLQANYNAIANTSHDPSSSTSSPFVFQNTGTVTLGEGSLISILPELDSKETTVGTELALRSQINLTGRSILLDDDSLIYAPNAKVSLSAGEWMRVGSNPVLVQSAGQVYLDTGAKIDVSGSIAVPVPVSQNILSIQLRGAELANSPLQRLGPLRNATVNVDIRDAGVFQGEEWVGTPLADIAGFANLIQRGVGELTVAGGSVDVSAGASFVMQSSSQIDVSGGSIAYQGGVVKTTQLITKDGSLVDIADARPDEIYTGIYDGLTAEITNSKWGSFNQYKNPLAPNGERFEEASVEGAAGGAISITAPSMALDGKFVGETINGDKQRGTPTPGSSLSLSFTARDRTYGNPPVHAPTPPDIIFQSGVSQEAAAAFQTDASGNPAPLSADRVGNVYLSPELLGEGGFSSLTVNNPDGDITVPEGVALVAPVLGSISLTGSNITVDGSVIAPGGSLSFKTTNLTLDTINFLANASNRVLPEAAAGRGVFTLGTGAVLSTAGLVVDDRATNPSAGTMPLVLGGGTVKIDSYSTTLSAGGLIDVSGGAVMSGRGKVTYGNGGSISISAGRDPNEAALLGGHLQLGATLQGYSGAKAGSLTLSAPAIQIGGVPGHPDVITLDPEFFNTGGFGSFSLSGIGIATGTSGEYIPGVNITAGTVIEPKAMGWLASSPDAGDFTLTPVLREEGVRTPVSLSFSASGANNPYAGKILTRGDVVMGEGAVIRTDAQASVSFLGQTVSLHGTVHAPAGSITVAGATAFPTDSPGTSALATTHLGATASLSTAGTTVLIDNTLGLRQGKVLGGGKISIGGNIIAESGAVLDVSGTRGTLDLAPGFLSLDQAVLQSVKGRDYVPVTIESNAGSISLAGAQMLYTDATLIGNAGGASATGGSLTVSSGRFVPAGQAFTSADTNLVIKQSGSTLHAGSPGVGEVLRDASGNVLQGIGNFAVDSYASGGFHSLSLNGNVRFDGNVSIQAPGSLRVATGGVITATGDVDLTAAHVALGQAFRPPSLPGEVITRFTSTDSAGTATPYAFAPVHGTGELTVRANLIDIGDLSLQGIGKATFIATKGDVRGNGTLSAAGDLTFEAGQIYPTTLSSFNIFACDYAGGTGSVTIRGGDKRALPFSAGGTLSIYASEITQGGTLRAPIGTINLGWNGTGTAPVDPISGTTLAKPVASQVTLASGSITSVSAIDPLTGKGAILPYGVSLDGNSWIDPAGNNITVSGLPSKEINLAAGTVTSESGSVIDMKGGGDLYAYRWVEGNGGRNDVLDTDGVFAVIPGYGFDYAPYAQFNGSSATNLGGDTGYTNSTLRVGDQITLAGASGLAAGTYTLLPARYALLPGAYLVTPSGGSPAGTVKRPDGSAIVSGYRANNLDPSRSGSTAISNFEVASSKVVRARSEYQDLLANTALREAAITRGFGVPRLPVDAGYLSFTASAGMTLNGLVESVAPEAGRGGVVDINSPVDILINGTGTGGPAGSLVLSASLLNSFGAESILIGGTRTFGTEGATVSVGTGNLTVDNAGSALAGSDIILVAKENLTLADGAIIEGSGDDSVDHLVIGDAAVAGSGDGSLVRVSGNNTASLTRRGVGNSLTPHLTVGAGASLSGGSIILDSTASTVLDPSARLRAESVSLNSGRISLQLENSGTLDPANAGLVLSGLALADLQTSAKRLSLVSYSTLDIYGTGTVGSSAFEQLSLQASTIRGFNQTGGTATFVASNLVLGNAGGRTAPAALSTPLDGTLAFDAKQITLGAGNLRVDSFANVELSADSRALVSGEGSFRTAGDLDLNTPLVTGIKAANHLIGSAGQLRLNRPAVASSAGAVGGLGAELTLEGAGVEVNSNISLPSGELTLHATTGDVMIGNTSTARLDLGGTVTSFVDVRRYTGGGTVNLSADAGSVKVKDSATISVAAVAGGGDAGSLNVSVPQGVFELEGSIDASAGSSGEKGRFSLDAGSIPGGSLAGIDATLNAGGFTRSRDYRIRTGDVLIDGTARSGIYRVAADSGDITVTGTIDGSGKTGGTIDLKANGSLVLSSGSLLTVAAEKFDSAGKGGAIVLEAGVHKNGVIDTSALLDLRAGSTLDLSVEEKNAQSAFYGKYSGTVHLRAPRTAANNDVQIATIGSTITDASSILVEGYKIYDLTGSGDISTTVQNNIRNDANAFLGSSGNSSAAYTAMLARLTGGNPGLDLILAPGAEIINRTGNLTLGSASSTASSDWNLSTFRFGPKGAAGVLTMRAAGDVTFYNALSDGFSGGTSLWLSPLNAFNAALPANSQTWSYRLTAGADFSAASFREVNDGTGTLKLGKNLGAAIATGGTAATTASIIGNAYQVIRTGSGDIDIRTGADVQLLNPFASIYTAGTRVADATTLFSASDFLVPILNNSRSQGALGALQQNYAASYSMAGGNVVISAGGNIERKTTNGSGLIDDSSRQLPNNWLYRRGFVGADGNFGSVRIATGIGAVTDAAASTTWWVDFSNFFQGVGALGGGNVSLTAGNDVKNVDAVIPTNARAPRGAPNANTLVELGGGDLSVVAGSDISGGVYYVERGNGVLEAGADITTNATRSPSLGLIGNLNNPDAALLSELAWMPTTLFVGKGGFEVTARGDVLLGPISNPFLLPQGLNNKFWYKTFFNTYAPDSGVEAISLGGDLTLRSSVALNDGKVVPFLSAWLEQQQLLATGSAGAAFFQPWLRLAETSLAPFSSVFSLSTPNLGLTALSGDVNLGGSFTLFPSARGQLEIVASGAVNALQALGRSTQVIAGRNVQVWNSATVNVSDADPASIPSPVKPLSTGVVNNATQDGTLDSIARLFAESGSYTGTYGSTQTKQALHTAGLLHLGDAEPVRIYAQNGDISGLTLFTPKSARIVASRDITDVSFYLQNLSSSDVSLVSAGRDLVAYNASSSLRVDATTGDNSLPRNTAAAEAGDIQIAGPGTLEVLAGRDIDLGVGAGNADGTGSGVSSIGNLRNPYLTGLGADIVLGAGICAATGLAASMIDFDNFIATYVKGPDGAAYLKEVAPGIVFDEQSPEEQARIALEIFYRVLRDTGRDFNDPESPGFRNYDSGMAAIKALFGDTEGKWDGDIRTQGRDIRTRSGGDISIFAPGGSLSLAKTTIGNPLAPPGIVTESGGNISIFTDGSVDIGIGRIFTLRGGNAIIWSTTGDIAAGSSSRTIQAAPPTRVIVDPQSASVETDLAGLATGGGIGVLATVAGVDPGNVDLIAPAGIIDAGDAGIRVSGNINLAAVSVVNAGNISAGGTSAGAPAAPSAPNISATTNASNSAAAGQGAENAQGNNKEEEKTEIIETPSLITVEVLGYGGNAEEDEEEEDEGNEG